MWAFAFAIIVRMNERRIALSVFSWCDGSRVSWTPCGTVAPSNCHQREWNPAFPQTSTTPSCGDPGSTSTPSTKSTQRPSTSLCTTHTESMQSNSTGWWVESFFLGRLPRVLMTCLATFGQTWSWWSVENSRCIVIAPTLDRAVGALSLPAKFGCSFSRPYYIGEQ